MLQRLFLYMFLSLILNKIGLCVERGCHGTDEVCAKCECSEMFTVVTCYDVDLKEIPHRLPRNLSKFIFKWNFLVSPDENSFSNCSNLQHLNLERNSIYKLPPNIFKDVPIQVLYLQNNNLDLNLNTEIFFPLSQTLLELNVMENPKMPQRVFNHLYKLESLSIDGNLFDEFGENFSTLKSLQSLVIGHPLDKLTNSTFICFQNICLKKLTLKTTGIKEIENEAFRPLKELKLLDLHNGEGLIFENVTHSISSLSNGLEELFLTNLYGQLNPTEHLRDEFFEELSKKKNLKKLKVDQNKIFGISNKMFTYTRSLEHLDFSHSIVQYIDYWQLLGTLLVNMTSANFEEQMTNFQPDDDIVSTINYSKDSYNAKYSEGIKPCNFKTNLKWNTICILCPRNLEELRLSHSSNLFNSFPVTLIFGNCKLTNFSYRNNGIMEAIGPIVLFRPTSADPVSLDFGDNSMVGLSPDFLKSSIERGLRVGRLILDGNNLSQQLEQDKLGKTFGIYSHLAELNLANNKLRVLHKLTFYNLTKLEILNLSSNSLQSLDFDISRLKELKVLDLNNNSFTFFDYGSVSELSQGRTYGWLTLYIEHNPFTCSCDSIDFINWITENKTKINNLDKITCNYKESFLHLSDLHHMAHDIKLSCYGALPVIISGAIFAFMIICIIICTIVYKYRWDIRYCLLAHSQKRRQYQLYLDQENDYHYDAFVSYDMDDRSWIVKELISNIEQISPIVHLKLSPTQHNTSKGIGNEKDLLKNVKNENYGSLADGPSGINTSLESITNEDVASSAKCDDDVTFRLCIHERDFELGNGIEENILNAIQTSRMVILIVSSHFIESKWCRLEVELAKMECLERGRNIVITILLEPIQEMLKGLEWFLKRYTYHEWFKCDTKSKKVEFWKRLKLALRGKDRRKFVCRCGRSFLDQSH